MHPSKKAIPADAIETKKSAGEMGSFNINNIPPKNRIQMLSYRKTSKILLKYFIGQGRVDLKLSIWQSIIKAFVMFHLKSSGSAGCVIKISGYMR